MTVSRDTPVYKLIHVGMPHRPVVLDAECRFAGVVPATRESFRDQATCALKTVVEFLNELRALRIYDSSLILLSSEHGSGISPRGFASAGATVPGLARIAADAMALLVVKPPGEGGALTISEAPSAITDIPATILDVLNLPPELPGESAFRLDRAQNRQRTYAYYRWRENDWRRNYLPTLHVFSVGGALLNGAAWSYVKTIFAPDLRLTAHTVDLTAARARPHLGLGWLGREASFRWSLGETSTIFMRLPRKQASTLTARLLTPAFNLPQTISVAVDGQPVGQWTAHPEPQYADYSVRIPPNAGRPRISAISFRYSRYRHSDNPVAARFQTITIQPD